MGLLDALNPFDAQNWSNFGKGLARIDNGVTGSEISPYGGLTPTPTYAYTPGQAVQNAAAAGVVVATSPVTLPFSVLGLGNEKDWAAGIQRGLGVSPGIALAQGNAAFAPGWGLDAGGNLSPNGPGAVDWKYTPDQAWEQTGKDISGGLSGIFNVVGDAAANTLNNFLKSLLSNPVLLAALIGGGYLLTRPKAPTIIQTGRASVQAARGKA